MPRGPLVQEMLGEMFSPFCVYLSSSAPPEVKALDVTSSRADAPDGTAILFASNGGPSPPAAFWAKAAAAKKATAAILTALVVMNFFIGYHSVHKVARRGL